MQGGAVFGSVSDAQRVCLEPLREPAEKLAAELGCLDRTTFTGWRTDIPDLMAASDIVIVSSYQEGFGLTMTEAMGASRPVIAYDTGAPPEVVCHGETGFIVCEGDFQALAERSIELVQDPALRHRMGAAGLARARDKFSVQRFLDETERVLAGVAGRA